MTWLHCAVPKAEPATRLICFPHAGGAASFYRDWGNHLGADVEVHAVRYPGRAERLAEPPATDLRALAADIAEAIVPLADRPVALFGHSLGAAVALETARSLEARGVEVAHLFASGSKEGPLPGPDELGEDTNDDDATILRLLELGGTPPEVAADPDFQELVLPYVRADGAMFHAYEHRATPALACPVTTIVGDVDVDADRRPWTELTPSFDQRTVSGDHFYLIAEPPYELLAATLTGALL